MLACCYILIPHTINREPFNSIETWIPDFPKDTVNKKKKPPFVHFSFKVSVRYYKCCTPLSPVPGIMLFACILQLHAFVVSDHFHYAFVIYRSSFRTSIHELTYFLSSRHQTCIVSPIISLRPRCSHIVAEFTHSRTSSLHSSFLIHFLFRLSIPSPR